MPSAIVWILILVPLALAGSMIWIYNLFVRDKNRVAEAWSGIDVQLKRRANLVPNLVNVVTGYADYEKNLLNEVTELRSRLAQESKSGERQDNENALTDGLGRLLAVVENYPDLKADTTFLQLQKQLVEIEDYIQMARRYYNGTVRNINTRVESFPSNLIAAIFGFHQKHFFEIERATERKAPQVKTT